MLTRRSLDPSAHFDPATHRRLAFIAAILSLTAAILDFVVIGADAFRTLPARAVWTAALATVGLLLPYVSISTGGWLMLFGGFVSSAACAALSAKTGGASSHLFPWMYALPPLFALAVPNTRLAALNAVGVVVAGAVVLHGTAGTAQTLTWLFGASLVGIIGVAGAAHNAKLRRIALELEDERALAYEDLLCTERRLLETEKLAVVGRLAAGVAHEINNPLAFVRSNLEHLRDEVRGPENFEPKALEEVFAETQVGVERIRRIVSDLRTFAQAEIEPLDSCDPAHVIDEALRISAFRLRPCAQLELSIAPGLPRVRASPLRLVEVIGHLLINAADALTDRGDVGHIRVRAFVEQRHGRVRIEVEDDGPGISPAARARLFEPFFTTKPPGKGTGLSLSLSREYVRRYGGTLTCASDRVRGAHFTIELPPYVEEQPERRSA